MSQRHLKPSTLNTLAMGAALLGVCASTAVMWCAPQRFYVAWVVPILVVWGSLVAGGIRGSPKLMHILLFGAMCRLALVASPPLLSDDLYRYLFEGLALNQGQNPFLHPPVELASISPDLAARVNHDHITSIYPPIAQWWFRFLALFGTHHAIPQVATSVLDIANCGLLYRICRQRHAATWPAMLYALHPLPILESASGAHLETLAVLCCLGTVLLLDRSPKWAWLPMTLGIGVKILPVLFVPVVLRRTGLITTLATAVVSVGLLGVLSVPILAAGPQLLEGFSTYGGWSFNALFHTPLEPLAGSSTKAILAVPALAVVGWACSRKDPVEVWAIVGLGFLFLTSVVHPWYAMWAFAPLLLLGFRSAAFAALTVQASYVVLWTIRDGQWDPQPWLWPLTWSGVLAAFAYEGITAWRGVRTGRQPSRKAE